MGELVFTAPDAGVWEQDGIHFPLPITRFQQEAFPEGFMRGFKMGTACYGLMMEYLEPTFINGFFYHRARIVGAPPDAKGPPPKEVFQHICEAVPEIKARLDTASTVLQQKPWREHLNNWDTVLKPTSTANHIRLQSQDLGAMNDAQLASHLQECFENSKAMVFQHHIYTITCGITVGDFMAGALEWTGKSPSEITKALRGSTPISAGITDEYLAALRAIETDPKAGAILYSAAPPAEVLDQLVALPGLTGAAIKTYLALVAHRVVGGYDIACKTAIESPDMLVKALQAKYNPDEVAAAEQQVREQTAQLRAAVPEPHRADFDERLGEARLVNRLRDERSYWSDLWSAGISRRAMLEVGRRLFARGRIGNAEHVLDASCSEALAMLSGNGGPDAAELAARHTFRTTATNDMAPHTLNGHPSPPPPPDWFPPAAQRTMRAIGAFMGATFGATDKASDKKVVRGISVSAGTYEGRARVINRMEALGEIQKGEVLVTRSTSTAFNYVLPLVGAIVTDRGGLMSHAAIVAREYGLPGVVGCQVATQTIPNGAMVRVDADKGEVTILS
jgi:pyruvate,water dikinase